jgi:hypothetical protein
MLTGGFAPTGSDDAVPKVIGDRTNCVFAINNDVQNACFAHVSSAKKLGGWQNKIDRCVN